MSENSTFIGAYDGECDDESMRGAAGGGVLLAELLCAEGYITKR